MINMLFNQSQEPALQENADVILNGGVRLAPVKKVKFYHWSAKLFLFFFSSSLKSFSVDAKVRNDALNILPEYVCLVLQISPQGDNSN